jgi:hypothetical protein
MNDSGYFSVMAKSIDIKRNTPRGATREGSREGTRRSGDDVSRCAKRGGPAADDTAVHTDLLSTEYETHEQYLILLTTKNAVPGCCRAPRKDRLF